MGVRLELAGVDGGDINVSSSICIITSLHQGCLIFLPAE